MTFLTDQFPSAIMYVQKINEKAVMIVDYESGRALPNPQIISKLERALGRQPSFPLCLSDCCISVCISGVHLRGEKAGQPKLAGRGKGHM